MRKIRCQVLERCFIAPKQQDLSRRMAVEELEDPPMPFVVIKTTDVLKWLTTTIGTSVGEKGPSKALA